MKKVDNRLLKYHQELITVFVFKNAEQFNDWGVQRDKT